MSRAGGYTLVLIGGTFSFFGLMGFFLGIPILFIGAIVVVRRSLDL